METKKRSTKKTKANKLEDMMTQLEDCVRELQRDDISLEDSFRTYSKGVELIQKCNDSIDMVEKEVQKLMDDGSLEPLE